MAESEESFLGRWSRLKHDSKARAERPRPDPEARTGGADENGPAEHARQTAADAASEAPGTLPTRPQPAIALEDIDIEALDRNSDYTVFLQAAIPADIRRKALAKLWLSDPAIGGPEQLSDYIEDYTDAARALPAGALRTAYRPGQGFLTDAEVAEWERLGQPAPAETPVGTITVAEETPCRPDVEALLAAAFAETRLHADDGAGAACPSTLPLLPEGRLVLVARLDGAAVGHGVLVVPGDGTAEVAQVWVAPLARRKGVAHRLLEDIEGAARARHAAVLRLATPAQGTAALALLQSRGFAECEPFIPADRGAPRAYFAKRLA